jgi:hypothetical protein
MAGDDVEVAARLRRRLEEEYGMREAAYLMDRPAGGWESLATKADLGALREYIDLRFGAIDARFDERLGAVDARFEALGEQLDYRFESIDHRFEALEHRLLGEIERRFRMQTMFLVSAMIAAFGLFGALVRIG